MAWGTQREDSVQMVSGKYPAMDERPQAGLVAPVALAALRNVTLIAAVCARQHPHVEK